MENIFIPPEKLCDKIGSKLDIYNLLTIDLGFYLPSLYRTPIRFLSDILSCKKKAIITQFVLWVSVPGYKEFSTAKICSYIKQFPDMVSYFPDFNDKEITEREYMCNVAMALRKYETQYLIKKVQKKRRIEVVEKKNNLIEIFPMMMKEIAEISAQKPHKDQTAFLVRKSAVLKGTKKKQIEYKVGLSILDRPKDYYDEEEDYDDKTPTKRYTDTIEMEEEEKQI